MRNCLYADGGNLISRASSKNDPLNSNQKNETKSEPDQGVTRSGSTPLEVDSETSPRTAYSRQRVENILLLLCCEDALHLYSMKSLKEVPLVLSIFISDFQHFYVS